MVRSLTVRLLTSRCALDNFDLNQIRESRLSYTCYCGFPISPLEQSPPFPARHPQPHQILEIICYDFAFSYSYHLVSRFVTFFLNFFCLSMKTISVVLFPVDGAIKRQHAVAELVRQNVPCNEDSIKLVATEMERLRKKMYNYGKTYVSVNMVSLASKTMQLADDEHCSGLAKKRPVRTLKDIQTSLAQDGSIDNFRKFFDVAWGQFEANTSVPWERLLEKKFMQEEKLEYDIRPLFTDRQSALAPHGAQHRVRVGCVAKVFSVARKRALKNLQNEARASHGRSLHVRRKKGEIDFTVDDLRKRRKPGVFYPWMVVRSDGRRMREYIDDDVKVRSLMCRFGLTSFPHQMQVSSSQILCL